MSKPSLVLVHGSWHSPEHFAPLTKDLKGHGYHVVTVDLPSMRGSDLPPASLADDTAAVRKAVTAELDAGHNVVVVAHSYGGTPSNNALEGLDEKSRKANGASTAVLAIAFLCAIPTPAGKTFLDNVRVPRNGANCPQIADMSKNPDFAYVGEPGAHHFFYHDLPEAETKQWVDMLRPQAFLSYTGVTSHAAYHDIPCQYLLCSKDQALPYEWQKGHVEAAVAEGARIKTKTLESAHSPWLSKLKETSEFIREVAGG